MKRFIIDKKQIETMAKRIFVQGYEKGMESKGLGIKEFLTTFGDFTFDAQIEATEIPDDVNSLMGYQAPNPTCVWTWGAEDDDEKV